MISDVDAGGAVVRLTLSVLDGNLTLNSINGLALDSGTTGINQTSMGFAGTLADINAALNGLQFMPDAGFAGKGGFFPINGELFGNSKNNTKNYHFTYELETEFVYQKGKGQVFTFTGDDDVWVFIDGKLVIDIGGVHGAASQTVELDRLSWLQDNEDYKLKFFFAERHRTESNFRMDTTMVLRSVDPPTTTALYD